MTAPSSPVTYGSPEYDVIVARARRRAAERDMISAGTMQDCDALLAADERAREMAELYAKEGRAKMVLAESVDAIAAQAETAEARAEAADERARAAQGELLHISRDLISERDAQHARAEAAEARCAALERGLRDVLHTLTVPAAEYVPAIGDAFLIIRAALTPPAPESKPDDDGRCTATFSGARCIFRAGHEGMHEPVSRGMRWP